MNYKEYTVRVWANGTKEWYLDSKLHREDGPAVEYADGTRKWYLNGKRHREDGAAVEYADGHKSWYLDGKLHKENGPAIEWANGNKEWCLDGEYYTEKEFDEAIAKKDSCEGKVVEIEGRKYRLTGV